MTPPHTPPAQKKKKNHPGRIVLLFNDNFFPGELFLDFNEKKAYVSRKIIDVIIVLFFPE